jgi:hypothetical protein
MRRYARIDDGCIPSLVAIHARPAREGTVKRAVAGSV